MVSNNTPLAGLVGIILVVAVIAALAALGFSGNDILNPTTSAAAAHAKELEIESKSQKDTIDLAAYQAQKAAETEKVNLDLANYKAIQAARAQAEQDKARLEVEAHQRKLDQDLTLARLTTYTLVGSGMLTLLVLGTGAAIFLGQLGRSRLVQAQAQAARTQMIAQARAREIAYREAELVQAVPKPIIGGNGKHPPEPVENTMQRVA